MPLWAAEVGGGGAFGHGAWQEGPGGGIERGDFFPPVPADPEGVWIRFCQGAPGR